MLEGIEIMYRWLKKYVDPICPLFAVIPLISCFALNMIVYSGTMILCSDWYHYDLTTRWDTAFPLVPGWVYIYVGCYIFWIVNYVMVARIHRDDKSAFYRFVITDMSSRLVCAVFFIALPTTNTRPQIPEGGFSTWLLRLVYSIDQPANLFPSIHCLVSWLCFAGIRKSSKVSLWYKAFSCIAALLVVLSTQFTKQHYWIDTFAGILIAEVLFQIYQRISAYQFVERFFTWVNNKLFILLRGELCE